MVMCEWSWVVAAVFVWWQSLVIIVGAVVVVCEWSWVVAVVFGWWQLFLYVGGHWLSFWAVILVFGWLSLIVVHWGGWMLVVVGCHVVIMDAVLLRWSAADVVEVMVKKRSHITNCYNGIMFELACEITCI